MLFRNRRLVRGLAGFFLLETLTSLLAPSVSWAVTAPNQVEFTSYESGASPDLVNLTTGDFTYNIPVLEVPGPDRSFSLPLTYRAGIRLEQDASWVGLGWSLNAGAIARSLNGYPDDASGEITKSTYSQKITRGWSGGVPGILTLGWDVNTGHSGAASLIGLVGLDWSGGGISSGNLVGIHASKEGVTVNPIEMVAAAVTIATLGTSASVSAMAGAAATQLGTDAATGVAASVLLGKASGSSSGWGQPVIKTDKNLFYTNYWVFFNDERSDNMYGSLNFDQLSKDIKYPQGNLHPWVYQGNTSGSRYQSPEFNTASWSNGNGTYQTGPGADLYQYNEPNEGYVQSNKHALSVAHDDFSVMGGNVSGNIRPYRLEVGSLAFPYQGLEHHNRYSTVAFLDDYKVPFRYESSTANSYEYHQATGGGDSNLGIESYEQAYCNSAPGAVVLKDPSLYLNGSRTAPGRKGIVNDPNAPAGSRRKLVQGKNIRWFSNEEIDKQLYATSADGPGDGSFLEVNHPTPAYVNDRRPITGYTYCSPWNFNCQPQPIYGPQTQSWHNNPWRVTLPGKGVGAFAITAEDGTTYHYSLPVYHYTQFSKSRQVNPDPGSEGPGVSTQMIGPQNWQNEGGGYATTWLLTAITSSDYVDRGQLGTVDDADWGGWVRFDYGRFSGIHKWRQPYLGERPSENSYNDVSYAEGYKQTYYLNSIRTRTHTALFVKSVRNDGRSHYRLPYDASGNLGFDERQVASSLRLDEIVLLRNEDLAKLKTVNGIKPGPDETSDIPALSENTVGNNGQFDPAELSLQDSYADVLDTHDLDADSRIHNYINQRATKRVRFNYSYRLCAGTPNSFPSARNAPSFDESQFACTRTGKLTLESLSIYGPANTKLTPDFKFTYGFNPDYQQDKWDGFGMYKSDAYVNTSQAPKTGHQVSTDYALASTDGAAWSLTEIINPLGGKTKIKYERDQYAKVSEYQAIELKLENTNGSNVFTTSVSNATNYLRPGDVVPASGFFSYPYTCYTQDYGQDGMPLPPTASDGDCGRPLAAAVVHIQAVSGNTVTIDPQDVPGPDQACMQAVANNDCQQHTPSATLTLNVPGNKNGGDLRVAAISTLDEAGNEYQIRYDYTADSRLANGRNSSGVISKEPAFIDRKSYDFDGWFDYPGTGVLYGKTTVVRGLFRNNDATDYTQREEYTFQTPVSTMVQPTYAHAGNRIARGDDCGNPNNQGAAGYRRFDSNHNITTINLGMVGQPLAIRKLNRRGEVESSTGFEYSNNLPNPDGLARQGYFTEGVMTNEMLNDNIYCVNRSTKVYQPTMLVATTTKTNGVTSRSQQDKFDFYTGQVVESSFRNSLGDQYRSRTVLAYNLPRYAAMGPASEQPTNRNMLTQEAASYLYKVRPNGSQAVVAASVQTWKDNWATYRGYDAGSDTYTDRADDPRGIWRLHESYAWVSPRTNADGTYADADFVDFNWSQNLLSNQAQGWVKAGEFTRYDHYSKPLESKDINGQYASRKLGYGQVHRLVTAANARYGEVAYSGAEDLLVQANNQAHFGGEVRDGGRQTPYYHHTGAYATQIPTGQAGFTYKAALGRDVRGGRKYRLSCWVYGANAAAELYAKVDGNDIGAIAATAANTKPAGNWYLLNLLVNVPASGQQLVVGCRNTGITGQSIYVDDFRFHPVESPTTAYVYDPVTAQLTDVLDNDNLSTHYEYDAAGKVKRISKEALTTPGSAQPATRVVKEYEYNYAQMTVPTWHPTGAVTWSNGSTGYLSYRQREERDINPASASYNTTRMVSDGYSIKCY